MRRLIEDEVPRRADTFCSVYAPRSLETECIPVLPMELLYERPLPRWKRLLDVALAGAVLVVLMPLFALIAVYIKLVSPGPILFGQRRVGYLGREFLLWKFRSMHHGADTAVHQQYVSQLIRGQESDGDVAMTKIENDPRIIPFGRLFRRMCLDEFPQLLNVLNGDMSLIGPRPALPYEVAEYRRWQRGRFDAVPGMTGLWQVSGKNRLTFKQMVRLDIKYARKRSLKLDLWILMMTIPTVVGQVLASDAPAGRAEENARA